MWKDDHFVSLFVRRQMHTRLMFGMTFAWLYFVQTGMIFGMSNLQDEIFYKKANILLDYLSKAPAFYVFTKNASALTV